MKTAKNNKAKAAPKPPAVSSAKGKPASAPKKRTTTAVLARRVTTKVVSEPPAPKPAAKRTSAKSAKPSAAPAKKVAPAAAKKRTPQHDSDYYAKIGQRGGAKLVRKYGTEFFADIARLSHPRKQYNGGRPKGSTKEKKLLEQAAPKKK